MGTRGLITFRVNGENKAAYVHNDAYASGMGVDVLKFLRGKDLDILKQAAADLKVVSDETPPSAEQIEALASYANQNVDDKRMDNWYVLLRETQGDPEAILACGYLYDSFSFGHDSLFCELAVVVDLDAMTFDAYKGFNSGPSVGLWADRGDAKDYGNGYASVTRVASFPLADLPTDADFIAQVDPEGAD
jgi:hypothetical protein